MEKLDKKYFRMLAELDYNARIPLAVLAKNTGISPQLAKYRLNKLTESGVIKGFIALIDLPRLGYYSYRLYLRLQRVTPSDYPKIIDFLKSEVLSQWVTSTSGRWDMEIILAAKSPVDFSNTLRKIKGELGERLKSYSVSPSTFNYHFKRTYLTGDARETPESFIYGFEYEPYELDETDIRLLELLSENARLSNRELGQTIGMSDGAVKERIRRLEKDGILVAYRSVIDLEKTGRKLYKAIISAKSLGEKDEKAIYTFCALRPEVVFFVGCFGEWDLEIEAEVSDESDFRSLMGDFMNRFGDVAGDYEMLHVYAEHKVDYFPVAAQLLKARAGHAASATRKPS
jgi:Lrp/AsnC family transcriptional regulator, leucine-responsive regulatory protein